MIYYLQRGVNFSDYCVLALKYGNVSHVFLFVVYWQVMEDIGLWGVIEVPYNNATVSNIAYNSGFYSFLQFTKYVRRGKLEPSLCIAFEVLKEYT